MIERNSLLTPLKKGLRMLKDGHSKLAVLEVKVSLMQLAIKTGIPVDELYGVYKWDADESRAVIDEDEFSRLFDTYLIKGAANPVIKGDQNISALENEMFLYGYVGFDIMALDFINKLNSLAAVHSTITVRINSPGGDVFEGLPIYNYMRSYKTTIVAQVDGLAASMASILMCGASRVKAASNALIMVHGPMGGDYTHLEKLETIAEMMKKVRSDMALIYSAKTGQTPEWIISNWLSDGKDHWFNANEAKAVGLVDEIYEASGEIPESSWSVKKIAAHYNQRLMTI